MLSATHQLQKGKKQRAEIYHAGGEYNAATIWAVKP